jgi:hypothetical protein
MSSTRKKSAALRRYLQAPGPVSTAAPYVFPPSKPHNPETTTSSKRVLIRQDPDLSKTSWQRMLEKPTYRFEKPVTGDRKRRHSPTGNT